MLRPSPSDICGICAAARRASSPVHAGRVCVLGLSAQSMAAETVKAFQGVAAQACSPPPPSFFY